MGFFSVLYILGLAALPPVITRGRGHLAILDATHGGLTVQDDQ